MSVLTDKIMEALDKILPEQSMSFLIISHLQVDAVAPAIVEEVVQVAIVKATPHKDRLTA